MIGRKIIQIESVDSTNNYIANLLSDGKIEHGTVILTDNQTKGRGQRGTEWLSNAGENLIFSTYLETANMSVNDQFHITQFISISVCDSLKILGLNPTIKWPNDIYIEKKKIAGILIENQIHYSTIKSSIVGIGLNVNQTEFGSLNATSIKLENGNYVPIRDFAFTIIKTLNANWEFIKNQNFEELNDLYLKKLWLLNTSSIFKNSDEEFIGIIRGVEKNGRLKIERENQIYSYDLKEISYVF